MNQRKKIDVRAVLIVLAFVAFAVVYLFGPFGSGGSNGGGQQNVQSSAVETQNEQESPNASNEAENPSSAQPEQQDQDSQTPSNDGQQATGTSKQDSTQQPEDEPAAQEPDVQDEPTPEVEEPQVNGSDNSGSTFSEPDDGLTVEEDGWYTSKDEVALYIHTYGHLPGNFISKTKAKRAGWDSSAGNLDEVCPGMSIGGSRFYNDEGKLPDARGREWTECDINYHGGYRGPERIVFSNDGLIFYTADHYETFEQLY